MQLLVSSSFVSSSLDLLSRSLSSRVMRECLQAVHFKSALGIHAANIVDFATLVKAYWKSSALLEYSRRMKLQDVQAVLEKVAPSQLAADWDEVGLHLAGNGKRIRRAMLCIDLTPDVLEEAIAAKCQLLVVYHPPIFRPLGRLADRDWKEVMLARAIRAGIAVYSPHSALDAVRGGMNDWLCEGLGEHSTRSPIVRAEQHGSTCYEEAAIDVIALQPEDTSEEGAGRFHVLETPVTVATLVRRLKRHLGLKKLKVALPSGEENLEIAIAIASVAVCVGAGGSLFENYWQADAYVTGEMQHHQILDMTLRGKVVILAGHTNSERPFLGRYRESIIAAGGEKVEWLVSETDRAPIEII